jgi:hypothetical protein
MADIFEVRGFARLRRGAFGPTIIRGDVARFDYLRLDGGRLRTRVTAAGARIEPAPLGSAASLRVRWQPEIAPGATVRLGWPPSHRLRRACGPPGREAPRGRPDVPRGTAVRALLRLRPRRGGLARSLPHGVRPPGVGSRGTAHDPASPSRHPALGGREAAGAGPPYSPPGSSTRMCPACVSVALRSTFAAVATTARPGSRSLALSATWRSRSAPDPGGRNPSAAQSG